MHCNTSEFSLNDAIFTVPDYNAMNVTHSKYPSHPYNQAVHIFGYSLTLIVLHVEDNLQEKLFKLCKKHLLAFDQNKILKV